MMVMQAQVQKLTLYMVLLNAFSTPLMLSSVNVALPIIARDLELNADMVIWIPMAYLMASAMFLLVFGKLADNYGRKKLFVIGTCSVIVISLLASMANQGVTLVLLRFFQGCSASLLYATQLALVTSVHSPKERGKVVGMTVSAIYVGLSVGPVWGGYLVDEFGWRSSFLLHIPLALIVLFMSMGLRGYDWFAEQKQKFDAIGAVMYALAIFLLCYGVSVLPDTVAVVLIVASIALFFLFLKYEYRQSVPLLDVRLFFTHRVFTYSSLASWILYTATFANVILISFYLQFLKSFSATEAGLIMMIQPMTMALVAPHSGSLSDRIEPRVIASVGIVITIIGLLLLALLNSNSHTVHVVLALFFIGLGFSLFSSPNTNAMMGSVDKRFYGSAAAVVSTMRIFGQLTSMVLISLFFSIFLGSEVITPPRYPQLEHVIHATYTIAALLCIPGFLLSLARGKVHD